MKQPTSLFFPPVSLVFYFFLPPIFSSGPVGRTEDFANNFINDK